MIPWFFALDHVQKARWLPIHLKDMLELDTHNLEVHQHFMKGCFVVHKTNHKFSAISLDQAHEHEEADTRLLLHVTDIVKNGMERVIIRTVDYDVPVLFVSYYFQIPDLWSCGLHSAQARTTDLYSLIS